MKWLVLLLFVNLTLSQDKNSEQISITEALLRLSEQTGYDISFKSDSELDQSIQFNFNDEDILKLLQYILPETKYEISIDRKLKRVIIKRKALTVSGIVLNKSSGSTIPYVNVYFKSKRQGTFANENGFFTFITDDLNKDTLIISAVGYETQKKELTNSDQLENMVISLESRSFIDNVNTVNAFELYRYHDLKHQVTISNKDLQHAPMSGENDVFDNLKHISDISAGETNNFALSLNSGGIHDNLFLLDGIRLFHTDHYYGNFSVFDGDAISAVTIYPINIPQNFSSVLSGVVELFSKDGLSEKPKFSISANAININATYGQKFSEKFNIFVQARRSIYDFIETDQFNFYRDSEITSLNTNGKKENIELLFYDMLTKLTYNINPKNQIKTTLFLSADYNKSKYNDVDFFNPDDFSLNKQNWGNIGQSLTWYSQLGKRSYLTFLISSTHFWSRIKTDVFSAGGIPATNLYNNKNEINYTQTSMHFNQSVSPNYHFTVGLDFTDFSSDYKDRIDPSRENDYKLSYPEYFINNEVIINSNHQVDFGLKITRLKSVDETLFLPRISYLWQISDHFKSVLSYSEHTELIAQQSTIEPLSSHLYDRWLPTTALDKRPEAKHSTFILSYQQDNFNTYQLKFYQKNIYRNFINYYEKDDDDTIYSNFQNVIYNGVQFSLVNHWTPNITTQLTYNYFIDDFEHDNVDYGNYEYSRQNLKMMTVYDVDRWRFTLSSKQIFGKELKYDFENQFTLSEDRKDYMILDFSALHVFQLEEMIIEIGAIFNNILDQKNNPTRFEPENPLNIAKPKVYVSYEEFFQGFSSLFHVKISF